ncbi:MAG: 6-phosphogluconolactonase [Gemmatimonadaceae bacterium]
MKRPERIVIEPRTTLAGTVADWIAAEIIGAVRERQKCAIALSGGNTPRAVYARLARHTAPIPWGQVDAYFGDERCVPPHHPESNFHMADDMLFRHVPIPRTQIFRMPGEWRDVAAAARQYERELPPSFDILLLGMGLDGHTASLFPGAPQLDERERRVVPSESPLPPPERLTITPPVITAARRIAVHVTGADKAVMLERVLEGRYDPSAMPVQLGLPGVWFLDREAASLLQTVSA